MTFFDHDSDQAKCARELDKHEHKAEVSHQLISGAAAYEAMKAYNDHCAREGKPGSHDKAKEIAAGLAGVMVDRIVETRGMDYIDREKAKRHAREQCEQVIVEKQTFDF